jgi:hypothetical protein
LDSDASFPDFAEDSVYAIQFEMKRDTDVECTKDVTQVRHVATNKVYRYIGTSGKLHLPDQTYTDTSKWTLVETLVPALDPDATDPITLTYHVTRLLDSDDNRIYLYIGASGTASPSSIDFSQTSKWSFVETGTNPKDWADRTADKFENYSFDQDTWTTGGGWLRKKTVHTKTTTTTGQKDYYTHYLKADCPIAIGVLQSQKTPGVFIDTGGDLTLAGISRSPTAAPRRPATRRPKAKSCSTWAGP